jgi:demethylmenaquinone methyltransferase/2-methoxy-6-polyprenyl-1,4-benzoquinol methylase
VTRGQGVYDRWSRHEGLLDLLYGAVFLGRGNRLRAATADALGLSAGDSVLDLGCGPGTSLHRLRTRVGPGGRVVGVDYSEGMVRRARERVRAAGWENVHVCRADATRLPLSAGFDAAHAAMSLSAMSDPEAAVREAARVLRPGGRMAALDARPFPESPWRALNPLLVPLFRWATDWNPGADVPGALAAVFGGVSVDGSVEGSVFVAAARNDDGTDRDGP